MIRRTKSGHQVVSEKGKPLSKPNLSAAAAKKRLAEVEMFKHMAESGKRRTLSGIGRRP